MLYASNYILIDVRGCSDEHSKIQFWGNAACTDSKDHSPLRIAVNDSTRQGVPSVVGATWVKCDAWFPIREVHGLVYISHFLGSNPIVSSLVDSRVGTKMDDDVTFGYHQRSTVWNALWCIIGQFLMGCIPATKSDGSIWAPKYEAHHLVRHTAAGLHVEHKATLLHCKGGWHGFRFTSLGLTSNPSKGSCPAKTNDVSRRTKLWRSIKWSRRPSAKPEKPKCVLDDLWWGKAYVIRLVNQDVVHLAVKWFTVAVPTLSLFILCSNIIPCLLRPAVILYALAMVAWSNHVNKITLWLSAIFYSIQ